MLFGFEDKWISAAYGLSIISCLLCVVYGALTWNRNDDSISNNEVQWASEEKKIEEEF